MSRWFQVRQLTQSISMGMALGILAIAAVATLPNVHVLSNPQAQPAPLKVSMTVKSAALPVTLGVPIAESANLLDAGSLGVVDGAGTAVPSSMRVLARWGGEADNGAKPIKWLLVDFKPTAAGSHALQPAARPAVAPISVSESAAGWKIANSQLEIELPKQGDGLIRAFKLNGAETLRAPANLLLSVPRRALIDKAGAGLDQVIVSDASRLKVGDEIRFEHVDTLKWDAPAGSSRLVTVDPYFNANKIYRLEEGTPRQEDVAVASAQPGDLATASPLKFAHAAGSTIRDLSLENETARIKSLTDQVVRFAAPAKQAHGTNEKLIVANAGNETAAASVDRAYIEEASPLRVVLRQDGVFRNEQGRVAPTLGFTLRYYVFADQPYVRARLRLTNSGVYGFGATYSNQPPYAQHALLRGLTAFFPTVTPSFGTSQVLGGAEAHARLLNKQSGASLAAGRLEISVPEFIETYPKALRGASSGMRFDLLPDLGGDYVFDGARARTQEFYLGKNTIAARAMTDSLNATLDPAYIASTGAVRPAFVEKRDWSKVFPRNPESAEAANRMERMMASSYAVEVNESAGATQAMSAYEYRDTSQNGEQFGWRNFGDLAWGDGFSNLHYDLPFLVLRESLRTGDARAFKLGSQMARFRADWGQYWANDYPNADRATNYRGMAFYEKGDHGSFREPVPSHMWIEGLWLYWAMTGDESVRESALAGSDAFLRIDFTNENVANMNETRWLGWPTLGLMAAYRYTGDAKYLDRARRNVDALVTAEENQGRKGYYLAKGWDDQLRIQPWGWSYSMLGVIEYWRETGDKRTAQFLVRSADWLIGKGLSDPPLQPGRMLADGSYLPHASPYFWSPDKRSEPGSLYNAGMTLPVLMTAARISNRADLWDRAQAIFRDYAFYRDLGEGVPVQPARRAVINFRSVLFPGSVTKAYGQMGLTVSDYLPESINAFVLPRGRAAINPVQPLAQPSVPSKPSPTPTPLASPMGDLPLDTMINLALHQPTTASSSRAWSNCLCATDAANDGLISTDGKPSIWHSEVNSGKPEWWQVDLGRSVRIGLVDILFRSDVDQPSTRRNFEVMGSNDPAFATSTRLGAQGDEAAPFRQLWRGAVNDAGAYRYIRVRKTRVDAGLYGESYFNLAEVRVFAPGEESSQQSQRQTAPAKATINTPAGKTAGTPPGQQSNVDDSLLDAPIPYPPPSEMSLTNVIPLKVFVGQMLDVGISPYDGYGKEMQIYAYNLPHGATYDSVTRRLRFPPNYKQAGSVYQVTFRGMNDQTDITSKVDIVVVVDGAPNIRLLRPTQKTRILTDSVTTISWSAPQGADISKFQIWLSMDGGATYVMLIAEVPSYQLEYDWMVPKNFPVANRSSLRVMVTAVDSSNRVGLDFSRRDLRVLKNVR